jgi:flagellar P-ring protein precursor FlgI
LVIPPSTGYAAAVRIKDIADFEGIRENMLVGYGLVVGLNGTGDSLNNSPFTRQSLEAMLERLGVNTRDGNINTDNVAAVMVTATLPPFARQGTRIDVAISSLGDAENLQGGMLLVTPLLGADGEVYAVAQGQASVSGFSAAGGGGTSITQGVPTAGRIANGAIIEREVGFELADMDRVMIALRNPDLTTARRIGVAVNAMLGRTAAKAIDPATVAIAVPDRYRDSLVDLMTDIEQLRVEPDQIARVVVDEVSGTIVMGEHVRISTVAIAQGNLTIRITETPQVSQPGAFAPDSATTVVVPRTEIEIDSSDDRQLVVMNEGVSLQELVDGLNALGVGPRDIISILQTIKASGALQADLELM